MSQSITANKAVEIHYTLTNSEGHVLDSSQGGAPLPYLHGCGALIAGLERELEGRSAGDAFSVSISPADGYGERQPELVQPVKRELFQFDGDIEVGMRFQAEAAHGVELVTVVGVDDQQVVIDANHPLAGETLNFEVEVISVRDASEEELAHGHLHHDEGGCCH